MTDVLEIVLELCIKKVQKENCMKKTNNIEELEINSQIEKSKISESYSEIKTKLPPNEIISFLSEEFDRFYCSVKKKSIEDKCILFQLFRRECHSILYSKYFYINSNNNNDFIQNALFDYIDCSISMMFFKNQNEIRSLNKRIDNELYFALLPFAIDRIEFPSLVKDEIQESLKIDNRLSISLKRRNFLANLMIGSRNYVIQIIEQTANHYRKIPTLIETEKIWRIQVRSATRLSD